MQPITKTGGLAVKQGRGTSSASLDEHLQK